jgi:hypothetical protein
VSWPLCGNAVKKDENGAEFVADRKTRVGKQVRAFDRYERHGELVIERTYDSDSTGRSTWTIHPVDANHSTLEIDAIQTMPLLPGLVMKPFLKRMFYGINFTPFIQEAERRTKERETWRGGEADRPGRASPSSDRTVSATASRSTSRRRCVSRKTRYPAS